MERAPTQFLEQLDSPFDLEPQNPSLLTRQLALVDVAQCGRVYLKAEALAQMPAHELSFRFLCRSHGAPPDEFSSKVQPTIVS
jgi:hypothetical protein